MWLLDSRVFGCCREKLRFPSGTATANVIRTLFNIDPDEPAEVVATMRASNDPAVQVRLPVLSERSRNVSDGNAAKVRTHGPSLVC